MKTVQFSLDPIPFLLSAQTMMIRVNELPGSQSHRAMKHRERRIKVLLHPGNLLSASVLTGTAGVIFHFPPLTWGWPTQCGTGALSCSTISAVPQVSYDRTKRSLLKLFLRKLAVHQHITSPALPQSLELPSSWCLHHCTSHQEKKAVPLSKQDPPSVHMAPSITLFYAS